MQAPNDYTRAGIVTALFGAVWIALGVQGLPREWATLGVIAGFVLAAVLIAQVRKAAHVSANGTDSRAAKVPRPGYRLIVVAEFVLAIGGVLVLQHFQLGGWWAPWVAMIVGLHFLPMAAIFRSAPFVWTAGAILAVDALACEMLRQPARNAAISIGVACILWFRTISAIHALGAQEVRQG